MPVPSLRKLLALLACITGCGPCARESAPAADGDRAFTIRACSTCHLFPEPALLPKSAWPFVLDDMALRVGLEPEVSEPRREAIGRRRRELRAVGMLPDPPLLAQADFDRIRRWYQRAAPVDLTPPPRPALAPAPFVARPLVFADDLQAVTLVRIDTPRGHVLVGDARTRTLVDLHVAQGTRRKTSLASPPVALVAMPDGVLAALLGSLAPTNDRVAAVFDLGRSVPVLTGLPRLTCLTAADLSGDGASDLVTCGFGDDVGELAWHEATPDGGWRAHTLADRAGFIQVRVADLDRDGRQDVVALSAQAREGVTAFLNRPAAFEPQVLAEWPPTWGCTDLQLADFDRDGDLDLAISNGDNDDVPTRPLKPYAGVRILEQREGLSFVERAFHPLPGAYQMRVGDYDRDGLTDLAVVAQYPRAHAPGFDSFLLLRARGAFDFQPQSVAATRAAPWATLDAGDLDGDGDLDLVLGLLATKGQPPPTLPSVLALENRFPATPAAE